MIPSQRHLFDIPDDVAYFNTAYMSPLMHGVVAAMRDGMQSKIHPWTYTSEDFFTYAAQARGLAAEIFGSTSDNIAIVPSASYGLQIATNALSLGPGQTVLVLEGQFPSNVYPSQEKAAKVGAKVRILPTPADDDWTKSVLAAIGPDTAIAALPHMHWASGLVLDLPVIRNALDNVGAALALDLTQSLGAMPFELADIRPDFAVAACYKWLLGPYSLGFLYIDPKWQTAEPLEHNLMNRAGSEDFTGLTNYRDTFQPGAVRFDMGEKSNPAQLRGASVAMQQILDWGIDKIADTLRDKTDRIAARVTSAHVAPMPRSKRAPHYLGLRASGCDPSAVAKSLSLDSIFVSVRGPVIRVTPHLFTSERDIDCLVAALNRGVNEN